MVLETCCCFVISIVTVMGHDNAARGGCHVSHYLVAAGKGRRSPLLSMLLCGVSTGSVKWVYIV